MGNRLSKKFKFQRENKDEYQEDISSQVIEKQSRDLYSKVDNIMLEKRLLKENKKIMVCDQISAFNDKMLKQYEFNEINDKLKRDKKDLEEHKRVNKKADALNYFPFTHGEYIEQQRADYKRELEAQL